VSSIFAPGSFFAARRSFLPRNPTFKIAAGAFAAGAILATVASNAPNRAPATDTAIPRIAVEATVVETKSAAVSTVASERTKPAKRQEVASRPNAVPAAAPAREVAEAAPQAARPELATVADAVPPKPAEVDDNVGLAAREAVPSPRPKPEALIAMAATPARAKPDALATLIAKLNAADAAGAPAPETAELSSPDTPVEPAAATAEPTSEPKPAAEAKPSDAKPHAAKPAQRKPAISKRAESKRLARQDNSANKPMNLSEVRGLHPMSSSVQSQNRADGFTLVRSRTLPDGRRVSVWQRPAEPRPSSPLLAFGSLFR
jgi:hypothetical protein